MNGRRWRKVRSLRSSDEREREGGIEKERGREAEVERSEGRERRGDASLTDLHKGIHNCAATIRESGAGISSARSRSRPRPPSRSHPVSPAPTPFFRLRTGWGRTAECAQERERESLGILSQRARSLAAIIFPHEWVATTRPTLYCLSLCCRGYRCARARPTYTMHTPTLRLAYVVSGGLSCCLLTRWLGCQDTELYSGRERERQSPSRPGIAISYER